jgi:hypothetical protein
MDKARQAGFAPGHGFRLLAQRGPDRIDGRDFFAGGSHDNPLLAELLPRKFVEFQNAPKGLSGPAFFLKFRGCQL